MPQNPILTLEHLSYIYSAGTPFEKKAVDDVSLEIGQGEFVGLIGHTGSGKSTLVQQLNGLLKPSSGRILVEGQDIWAKKADRRALRFQVGLVFQYPEYQLFEETVAKDIAFGPKNMGLSDVEVQERVHEAAGLVGLPEELLPKSPFELSGGQKRRAAIAGVMAMEPRVLVLDEPAAGLDPFGRASLLRRVSDYRKTKNATVLLVSHSMEDVAEYATRVLVMNQGRAELFGTVPEVFAHSEELVRMGLDIPQVTQVFLELRRRGYGVSSGVYTVEAAKRELLRCLKGGGAPC